MVALEAPILALMVLVEVVEQVERGLLARLVVMEARDLHQVSLVLQ